MRSQGGGERNDRQASRWLMALFRVRLPSRRGVREGGQGHAGGLGGEQAGEAGHVHAEAASVAELGHQADVGERRRVPEAERAGGARDKASQAASPAALASAAQACTSSSGRPIPRRRASTPKFCKGCVSAASARAKARTRARSSGAAGNRGGSG